LNNFRIFSDKKAGVIACLFLLCGLAAVAQEWHFDAATEKAYQLVLNLQTDAVHQQIPKPVSVQEHYVTALAEALELLITEDAEKFNDYETRFEERRDRKTKLNNPDELFLQAEIGLQWAFVYLKFGHEFDGALSLRQAYQTTQEIKKRFPAFKAINKTSGLLDVIIGSVPEKYNWVLGLLNMEGSIEKGLRELESIQKSSHPLAFEASLLYSLTQGFILQQNELAMIRLQALLQVQPANRLALFLGASLAIKNSQSEEALTLLTRLADQATGLPIYYADYLKGEVYLHKAEYLNAISSYRWFINHYKGQNYTKDATYKTGLCYWLNGNSNDAHTLFELARSTGREITEADKYAARSLAENEPPHIGLTKVRYFTDGGYYTEAAKQAETITQAALPTQRDKVEFVYRKARLAHKTNDLNAAKNLYRETVSTSSSEPWYFAPNSCLQLGYIALQEKETVQAEVYFEQALSYKKHEYKNSIDSKARSALSQLKARK